MEYQALLISVIFRARVSLESLPFGDNLRVGAFLLCPH